MLFERARDERRRHLLGRQQLLGRGGGGLLVELCLSNATVNPAVLIVTAPSSSSGYGFVPTLSPSYSGFLNGDDLASLTAVPTCTSSITAATPVGTYSSANNCSGGEATNYSFAYMAGEATVTKAVLTVTASPTSTPYGSVPVVTPSYSGFMNGDGVGSLSSAPGCTSSVTATTHVGLYDGADTCSGGAATNYSFDYVPSAATVTEAVLSITASSTTTSYGTAPVVTASYSGFVNGDGPGTLTALASCTSVISPTSAVGTYGGANTCSGAASADYSIVYVAGSATVTPAALTVTASSTTTTYGTGPVVTASYSGFENGDGPGSLATLPTCGSIVLATSAVGGYVGANSCSGASAANYSFTYLAGNALVTPATLSVTASPSSSTYGTAPVVTASYSGFVNGDGVASLTTLPTCSSSVTATSAVGSYPGANSCSGGSAADYAFSYTAESATVTPATLSVTASPTSSVYGTTPLPSPSYSGFVNGDGLGSLDVFATCSSAVSATTGVGSYPGANTCSGAAAENYVFSYDPGEATVTPASLTVTASSTSSTYGTVPMPDASYSGFVNGDGPGSLSSLPACSSAVTAASGAGSYSAANTCSGGAATNYSFSYNSGDATVTPASLSVTASPTTSVYGTTPLPSPSYSGFVNGDGLGSLDAFATCSSAVSATSGVGSYPGANTCSGAAAENYTFSYVAGDASVTAAALTVTASATSSSYGTVPAPSPGYSGFVNGDGPSSLTSAPTCVSSVTATTPAGTYPGANTCSGAAAANYSFTYVAGDATVLAGASLSIVNGTGQPGRPDQGDQIIITFDPVPSLANMCNGDPDLYPAIDNPNVVVWGTAPLLGDDTVTVTDSVDCSGGLNVGSIDLGQAGYFNLGTSSFGGPSSTCNGTVTSGCSSIAWNGSNTLTITLGAPEVGEPTQGAPSVAGYTPAPQLGLSGTISSADEENF